MGMTLEDAADDLSAKLGALDEDIREATEALGTLRDRAAALQDQIDADFAALETQAKELLAAVAEEQASLEREADEVEQALRTLTQAVEEAEDALEADLGEAAGGAKELAAHVTGLEPGLLEAVSNLETEGRDLATAAADAESQWEQAFAQSRAMQDEMTSGLESLASELRQQAEEAAREVEETEGPRLDAAVAGWETVVRDTEAKQVEEGLAMLRDDFEKAFGEACTAGAEHARTHVGEATTVVQGMCETAYVQLLKDVMECSRTLQAADETVGDASADLLEWLDNLADALSVAQDELASLGFM